MKPQVLIAGAGPTGLTLGIDLARRGVAVRIVDKAEKFFDGSRGDGIQPRTLEVFGDLGVLDAVLDAGTPQALMRVYLGGEFVMHRRMTEWREPTPDVPHPNPWVLGQSDTERILRDRLAEFGVRVELSTALVDFNADEQGVTATLSHVGTLETVRADYLVGADGGRSTVRKALGIAFEGTTDESIRMLLGDVRVDSLDHTHGYWFAEPDAPMDGFAMTPLPHDRKFQFMAPLAEDSGTDLASLQAIVNTRSQRTDIVLSDLTWSTVWRPNIRLAEHFRAGRVFLAGDAAHVHPPTGGQGMNTGVQDAYNLGWKLEAALRNPNPDTESLLDTYETERRTVAARVLGLSSDLLDKTVQGDADAMNREGTQQLDISYRNLLLHNPSDPSHDGRLHAGDRAPDAPLSTADGATTLFDLFRGPHATLLVFGDAPTPEITGPSVSTRIVSVLIPDNHSTAPISGTLDHDIVIDIEGHAFHAYGVTDSGHALVRPDGYVGALAVDIATHPSR
ncbi:FAD-dependent monooxygenase [Nocardia sp. NPDC051030]|uniref:FAD-dependent monooxygenase n=1 Tax=Nocardia sp. NPDC051030 TaxID=3155162 RepID=UPI00341CAC59